jgi:hypothetical protein
MPEAWKGDFCMSANTNAIKKGVKEWLRHVDEDLRLGKHAFELKSGVP